MGPVSEQKQRRQQQSCDGCRTRKIRCYIDSVGSSSSTSCKHCSDVRLECTYQYVPKRRGPPALYTKRLEDAKNMKRISVKAVSLDSTSMSERRNLADHSRETEPLPPNSHNLSTENYPDSHSGIFPTTETFYPSATGAAHSTKSSTSGDGYTKEPSTPARRLLHPHGIQSRSVHMLRSETLGQIGKSELQAKTSSATNNYSLASSIATLLNPSPPSQSSISPNYCQTDSAIDRVLPRPLLYLIIGLFKDFVYPLTPCVHVPTLYQDLARRRELEYDQSEWTALVFAIVMSTLVQVPRAFVPLSRSEVSALAERCLFETRQWSMSGYSDNLTVNAVVICFFRAVYTYVRDRGAASCHTALLEAQALATVLKLHDEESYIYLGPIEREVRRRTYFLLFCADKSECVLLGRPIKMPEEDCYALRLPEELDDEYITQSRYLQQPPGQTSLITGFNAAIRIYCLIGRIMTKWRNFKRNKPSVTKLHLDILDVQDMLEEVMGLLGECPPELALKGGMDSRVQSPNAAFAKNAEQVLQELFFDPSANREYARDAYLVQAGNIYVNQQLARFVLLQYQYDLLVYSTELSVTSERSEANDMIPNQSLDHLPPDLVPAERSKDKTGYDWSISTELASTQETLFYDLLTVLHSIPIQCIAVNGPSLVNSVRYVASALLDRVALTNDLESSIPDTSKEQNASVFRAQGYLIDFLSILSEIEKHYSWDDLT